MLVHDIDHAIAEAPQEEEGANQSKGHKVIAPISGAKEGRLVHKKGEMIEAQKLSGFSNIGERIFRKDDRIYRRIGEDAVNSGVLGFKEVLCG
jgi:hypothetical protein